MTLPDAGATPTVKFDGVVTASAVVDVALCDPTVTVMSPVAAPEGITKLMLVAVKLETGAERLPPPWGASVTTGVALPPPVKLVPESATDVPSGPDPGEKPVIVGGEDPPITVRLILAVCVKLLDVPVTVTVALPVVAEPLAVSVKVLEPVVLLGLNT